MTSYFLVIAVGFEFKEYSVEEGQSVEICIVAEGSQQRPVEVSTFLEEAFDIIQGSKSHDDDNGMYSTIMHAVSSSLGLYTTGQRHILPSATVILGENATSDTTVTDDVVCYMVSIADENVKEGIEVIFITLNSSDSAADSGRDLAMINVPSSDCMSQ